MELESKISGWSKSTAVSCSSVDHLVLYSSLPSTCLPFLIILGGFETLSIPLQFAELLRQSFQSLLLALE